MAPFGPFLSARCQEYFEGRIREHVVPMSRPSATSPGARLKALLQREKCVANGRQSRDLGRQAPTILGPELPANLLSAEPDLLLARFVR